MILNLDEILSNRKLSTGLIDMFVKTQERLNQPFLVKITFKNIKEIKENLLSRVCHSLFFKISPNRFYDSIFDYAYTYFRDTILIDLTKPIDIFLIKGNEKIKIYSGLMDEGNYSDDMTFPLEELKENISGDNFYLEITGLKSPTVEFLYDADFEKSRNVTNAINKMNQSFPHCDHYHNLFFLRNHPFENIFQYNDYLISKTDASLKGSLWKLPTLLSKAQEKLNKSKATQLSRLELNEYHLNAKGICR